MNWRASKRHGRCASELVAEPKWPLSLGHSAKGEGTHRNHDRQPRDAFLAVSQGGNLAALFGARGAPVTKRSRCTGATRRHDLFSFVRKNLRCTSIAASTVARVWHPQDKAYQHHKERTKEVPRPMRAQTLQSMRRTVER